MKICRLKTPMERAMPHISLLTQRPMGIYVLVVELRMMRRMLIWWGSMIQVRRRRMSLYLNLGICTWSLRNLVSLRGLNYLTTDLFLLVFGRKAKEIYVTRSWSWNRRSMMKGGNFSSQLQYEEAESTIYIINHFIITTSEEGDIITWVWALPLATPKLGGGAPVSYHHHTPIFTVFLSSIHLVISWSSRIKFCMN